MSKFIIADSAQIEARVLAWLSGQDDLLQGFADGEDVYSQFASRLFKCTVRKPDEGDPEPVQKYLTIKRGFGKDAVLGCIAAGTPVLTKTGFKSVEKIVPEELLWDGKSWVSHSGLICRGVKQCIKVEGIWITPEHEVLNSGGWTTAAELNTLSQRWGGNTENSQ